MESLYFISNLIFEEKMHLAAIFDMDGVLVDNAEFHYLAWKQFCKQYKIFFSEEKFKTHIFGRTNNEVLPAIFETNFTTLELENLSNEKEKIYREIYAPHIKPVKGLLHFLEILKQNNFKIGVATSAPRVNAGFIIDRLKINDFIDVVVDESMVKNGKPHPEIYLKTAQLLQIPPQNCVVFEDSLSGTQSANAAGATVFALTTTLPENRHRFAHFVVPDFSCLIIENQTVKINKTV